MRRSWLEACGIVAAIALSRAVVWAAVPSPERLRSAAEEFDSGRRAYQLRDFESAAVHFENADRDSPSADALFAAIRSRYQAGQLARAATLAASGLSRYPHDKNLAAYSGRVLPEADRSLHRLVVKCAPECTVVLDGKLVPVAVSAIVTVYLDLGAHSAVAGWSGDRHVTQSVAAKAGGVTELSLVAPPLAPIPDEPTSKPSVVGRVELEEPRAEAREALAAASGGMSPAVFWVGAGVTAVLGGVSIWSGIDTIRNPGADTVRAACETHSPECQALFDQGKAREARTNALLLGSAGAGLATAAVGLFWTDWKHSRSKTDAAQTITPLLLVGSGLAVGARGRF